MELTKKQKKELVECFRQHDFTQAVPVIGKMKIPDKQAQTYIY